ncbi:MAG: hypothetical protein ACYC77_03520 [Coriobacteriia bacterium]
MRLETAFRPSLDGFAFANAWKDLLFGVFTSRGRCGGMVFAALDRYDAGTTLPPASTPAPLPAYDSALSRLIWRKQVASVVTHLGWNLWRFAALTYLPTPGPHGVGVVTRREFVPLFDSLAAGRPAPLGLVSGLGLKHLARNHQVLAWAADFGDRYVRVNIYDPNHPLRDDIVLEVPFAPGPVVERIGGRRKAWRGFFVERRPR